MKHKFNPEHVRHDIYKQATDTIVAALEKGVRPWVQPWSANEAGERIMRPLRHNGQPYNGINVLMLWAAAVERGFTSPIWISFKQAQQLGGNVRKGEHGAHVVYADKIRKTEHTDAGDVEKLIPFLKQYTVFNVNQVEGLPHDFYEQTPPRLDPVQRIAQAEEFIAATKADMRTGGARAFYSPDGDYIRMPAIDTFKDPESYYSTALHELTHWTKGPGRIERDFGRKKWGDEGYAMEELVAELGATFLCADLDLTPVVREENAAYIANWIKVLKSDPHAVFNAAAHAGRSSDLLHSLQPERDPEADYTPANTSQRPEPEQRPTPQQPDQSFTA